jgi:hypothetical protein
VRSQVWNAPERCRQILAKLWEDPYATSFQYPVDTNEYEDYLEVVNEPICLEDVKRRLEDGTYKGHTLPTRFASDVREIWKNCKIYNLHKSQIWYCAHTLSLMFERLFQAWVLSFQEGLIPLSDPLARPWENSCRVCLEDENDDQVLLCDHCDASYHLYCLNPPLSHIPEDLWICPHCTSWLKRTGTKCLSATVEDEARLMTDNAKERKITKIKRKKYLVKWRGLSFRDCTWETASDINDDQAIAVYHQINDTPPEEPPLTQAEIGVELSKERKSQRFPALQYPHALREADAAVYSQIRAMHFLRFNLQPTNALLKECGPWSLSRAYGARYPMKLPMAVVSLLDQVWAGGVESGAVEETEEAVKKEKSLEEVGDMEVQKETEELIEGTVEAKKEEAEEESESSEDDEEDWNTFRLHYRVPYVKGMTAEETLEAAEAAFEARNLARKKSKLALKSSSSMPTVINPDFVKQSWYVPPESDSVNNEVASTLGDLMHTISRGTPNPPRSRPPLRANEIELCVPKGDKGLYLNIGDYQDRVVVLGFRNMENGNKAPIEASGKVKSGDILVAVNGLYITHLNFRKVVQLIATKEFPFLYLRLIRLPPSAADRLQSLMRAGIKPLKSTKLIPVRSGYVGVTRLREGGRYKVELIHDYNTIFVGIFDSEVEAAEAYDSMALKLNGNNTTTTPLNFVYSRHSDGTLTIATETTGEPLVSETVRLRLKAVEAEQKLNLERVQGLEVQFEEDMEVRKKEKVGFHLRDLVRKADSEDSFDSDSDLHSDSSDITSSSSDEGLEGDEDGDDDDDDTSVSTENEEWDSDKQENDKEWKPKDNLEAGDGPFGRLLRAVNESEYPPLRSEWNNYILELGNQQSRDESSSSTSRKVEQLDLSSGIVIRTWDSVNAASRGLSISSDSIQSVIDNKLDNAGGFKWKAATVSEEEEEVDTGFLSLLRQLPHPHSLTRPQEGRVAVQDAPPVQSLSEWWHTP